MRRAYLLIGFVGLSFLVSCLPREDSASITLYPSGDKLTYTVVWGLGMKERWSYLNAVTDRQVLSEWAEIWKKPYNSGAPVYMSDNGKILYLGTFFNLGIIAADEVEFTVSCDHSDIPELTELGKSLASSKGWRDRERLDPDAPHFPHYIRQNELSVHAPVSPPSSKYYLDFRYVGRFGVFKDEDKGKRGGGVGFSSAIEAPEPRMALRVACG